MYNENYVRSSNGILPINLVFKITCVICQSNQYPKDCMWWLIWQVNAKLCTHLFLQAKVDGFLPGGASLHNCMTPHGPDTKSYEVWLFLNHQLEALISFFNVYLSILTTGKHCPMTFVELVYALKNKIMNCWVQLSNVFFLLLYSPPLLVGTM